MINWQGCSRIGESIVNELTHVSKEWSTSMSLSSGGNESSQGSSLVGLKGWGLAPNIVEVRFKARAVGALGGFVLVKEVQLVVCTLTSHGQSWLFARFMNGGELDDVIGWNNTKFLATTVILRLCYVFAEKFCTKLKMTFS